MNLRREEGKERNRPWMVSTRRSLRHLASSVLLACSISSASSYVNLRFLVCNKFVGHELHCRRSATYRSVAGIIYTFGGQFVSKMYWGTSETLLPVYQEVSKAMAKHPDVDVVVNFASSRSVYSSTLELMEYSQVKTIAIIAEGVPERVCT